MNWIQAVALYANAVGAILFAHALITTIVQAKSGDSYVASVIATVLVGIGMLGSCIGFINISQHPLVVG